MACAWANWALEEMEGEEESPLVDDETFSEAESDGTGWEGCYERFCMHLV